MKLLFLESTPTTEEMTMKTPKFTRQDFEYIAATIRDLPNIETTPWGDVPGTDRVHREVPGRHPQRAALAVYFADALAPTNPNFDRARFIAAATRED